MTVAKGVGRRPNSVRAAAKISAVGRILACLSRLGLALIWIRLQASCSQRQLRSGAIACIITFRPTSIDSRVRGETITSRWRL